MAFNMLIVDDSSSMRSIIKKTIQMSGFDVGICLDSANGEEALKVLKDQWVDVILTDIHMPVMDGIGLLRKLKEDDLLKSIPVVIITTEGREQKLDEALSLGACVCIKKPFTPEQIRRTLTDVLGVDYVTDDQRSFGDGDF
jgi:two-component system, chemotaxis family, chemotaxis protein CheY